jgi:hypothetical protein
LCGKRLSQALVELTERPLSALRCAVEAKTSKDVKNNNVKDMDVEEMDVKEMGLVAGGK